jgi:DNA-binding protein
MEKYRLVEERKKPSANDVVLPNEVRITQQGKPRNYITYAMNLLAHGDGSGSNKGVDQVILKAMGRAVNKAVTIAEILKRKAPLHQITSLSSVELTDIYEPLEEGLDIVESKRYVSCMTIILSKTPLDISNIGYQVRKTLSGPVLRFVFDCWII